MKSQFKITYTYDTPSHAGPFRGKAIIESETKPIKGDMHYGTFGQATIQTVSRIKQKQNEESAK